VKQPAEAADFTENLRAMRLPYERLNLSFKPVPKVDVYAD